MTGAILAIIGIVPATLVYFNLSNRLASERVQFTNNLGEINKRLEEIKLSQDELSPLSTISASLLLPSSTPKPTTSTSKKWSFKKSQYEVNISNINYVGGPFGFQIEFDVRQKNISITPFITGYSISECIIVKNNIRTQFVAIGGEGYEDALSPGESKQVRSKMIIRGYDYDESGNKVQPSGDLRIKTCSFYPLTKISTSQQLGSAGTPITGSEKVVEPTTIFFQ